MSAAELGRQLEVPTNRVTAILHGRRSITGDTALRLGHFFGNSPQFWLNPQALHDLRTAERKVGGAIHPPDAERGLSQTVDHHGMTAGPGQRSPAVMARMAVVRPSAYARAPAPVTRETAGIDDLRPAKSSGRP